MTTDADAQGPKPAVGHRLLMHGGVYTAARLINQALVFLLLPLYARKLGSEGLGVIEITNTARNVLALIFLQGLGVAWFRLRLTHKTADARRSFEASIIWYLLASSLALLGLLAWLGDGLSRWLTPGVPFYPLGLVTTCTAATLAFPTLLERHLQAQQKPAHLAAFSVARTLLTLGTILWFVLGLERGAAGKIQAELVVGVITGLWALAWLRPLPPSRIDTTQLRAAVSYGRPQIAQGLMSMLNDMIDRLFISHTLGLAAVGVYAVGYRVASVTMLLMSSVVQAFSPLFIETMHDAEERQSAGDASGADQLRKNLAGGALGVLVVAAGLAQGVSATGREVITLVAPAQVAGAWPILGPVGLGVVLWSCHLTFVQSVFYSIRSAHLVAVIGVVGAGCNVLVNLLLLPRIGIMGAAWATLVSNAVYALISWHVGRRITPLPYEGAKYLSVLAWTGASLAAFYACDASSLTVSTRLGLKAVVLAATLLITLRLAGLTPSTLRGLRARLAR